MPYLGIMSPTRYRLRQPRCCPLMFFWLPCRGRSAPPKAIPPAGLEPATFGLEVQRAIHCAKGAIGVPILQTRTHCGDRTHDH